MDKEVKRKKEKGKSNREYSIRSNRPGVQAEAGVEFYPTNHQSLFHFSLHNRITV